MGAAAAISSVRAAPSSREPVPPVEQAARDSPTATSPAVAVTLAALTVRRGRRRPVAAQLDEDLALGVDHLAGEAPV
ncbi:hypothetical protein ABZ318_02870, partial [Streptomyces sp. NPDC006197]|uniref:hypothetical protein n=1 Tax=Streptomyces sp. NPDC006197 TaxID=3156685 RepID=UPI0033BEEAAA